MFWWVTRPVTSENPRGFGPEQSLGQTQGHRGLGSLSFLSPRRPRWQLSRLVRKGTCWWAFGLPLSPTPGSAPLRGLLLLPPVSHPWGQGWALRTGTLCPSCSAPQHQAAAGSAVPLGSSRLSHRHSGHRGSTGCPLRPGEPACGAAGGGRAEARCGRTETRAAVTGSQTRSFGPVLARARELRSVRALLAPGGFFVRNRLRSGTGTGNVRAAKSVPHRPPPDKTSPVTSLCSL